jgi:hypothetical protein
MLLKPFVRSKHRGPNALDAHGGSIDSQAGTSAGGFDDPAVGETLSNAAGKCKTIPAQDRNARRDLR